MSLSPISRDPVAWQQKIKDAKPDAKKAVCEEALQIWPAATEVWLSYIQLSDDAGEVLAKCLPRSVDPKLYEVYIDHIKKTKPEDLGAAFEYVLNTISFHPDSGVIWRAYIDWIANQPVANDWEETFRRDKVRKAYKRAVTLPLANIEALWKSYGQFETRISRVSARKFIDERSAAYMKARSAYRTYQTLTKGLSLSTMPSPGSSRADAPRWRGYIEWERSNPLELEDEAEVSKRVYFAYKLATQSARWSPQLWFDAGTKADPVFWEQGSMAMPESFLLAFKLTEYHENSGNYGECKAVLDRLNTYLSEHAQNSTPGWVELVKCTHRMKGIGAAREVIQQCLSALPEPSADIYIVAANLEKTAGNKDLEAKIWEFAYKQYGSTNMLLVSKYIDFLFGQSDVVNARSVFEQAVGTPLISNSGISTRRLWDQMLMQEAKYAQESESNLKSLQALEKRYLQLYPGISEVDLFMQRFGDDAQSLFQADADADEIGRSAAINGDHMKSNTPSSRATPASATPSMERIPDGPVKTLLSMLPPPNVYDGPMIDNQLLMTFVMNVNT